MQFWLWPFLRYLGSDSSTGATIVSSNEPHGDYAEYINWLQCHRERAVLVEDWLKVDAIDWCINDAIDKRRHLVNQGSEMLHSPDGGLTKKQVQAVADLRARHT